jgi:hypothetical protein
MVSSNYQKNWKSLAIRIILVVASWMAIFTFILTVVPKILRNTTQGKAVTVTSDFLDAIYNNKSYQQYVLDNETMESELEQFFEYGEFLTYMTIRLVDIEDGIYNKIPPEIFEPSRTIEKEKDVIKFHYLMQFKDFGYHSIRYSNATKHWNDFIHVIISVDTQTNKISSVNFNKKILHQETVRQS